MVYKKLPSVDRLNQLFYYDKKSGKLIWKIKKKKAGKNSIAGSKTFYGYVSVGVDGQIYKAHRVVWKLLKGVEPPQQIDHVNGVRDDNRIENLREATPKQNSSNIGKSSKRIPESGYSNIYKHNNLWRVRFRHLGKDICYGLYPNIEKAISVREQARKDLGFSKRHGK